MNDEFLDYQEALRYWLTHEDEALYAIDAIWQWLTDALEQIRRESGDFDPRAEYEANWESAWLEERERRRAALEAAKRRVASIPADHRRYLEGEFLRAEHKAAAIVAHGRTPCPHCPCTYSTECCYCDGSRTPLEDS